MGRKARRGGKNGGDDTDLGSEMGGDKSSVGDADGVSPSMSTFGFDYHGALDGATEKSASRRTAALKGLCDRLTTSPRGDEIGSMLETVLSTGTRALRGGKSPAERALGAQLFCVAALSVGMDISQGLHDDAALSLINLAGKSQPAATRAHAMRCLGVLTLVSGEDPDTTLNVLRAITAPLEALSSGSAGGPLGTTLAVACLESLAVAVSVAPAREMRIACDAAWRGAVSLLDAADVGVKIAAGSFLTLALECDGAAQSVLRSGADLGSLDELAVADRLPERLRNLAVEYDRSRAKDELQEQRVGFARLVEAADALFSDGLGAGPFGADDQAAGAGAPSSAAGPKSIPVVTFKIGGAVVELESLSSQRHHLEIKRVLGQGFQAHCIGNGLVRDILGISGVSASAAPERLSKIAKRKYRSPNSAASKARTVGRARDRDISGRNEVAMGGAAMDQD